MRPNRARVLNPWEASMTQGKGALIVFLLAL